MPLPFRAEIKGHRIHSLLFWFACYNFDAFDFARPDTDGQDFMAVLRKPHSG